MSAPAAVRAQLSPADAAAFATYERVRDAVLSLKGSAAGTTAATPSRYWTEELANIDYMLDASPLVIRKLRHHAYQITGIRPYDYREYGEQQANFERRLRALIGIAGDDRLLVPEHEALGGFGYRIDGRLYNVDTLKFFEALVAMRRSGIVAGSAPRDPAYVAFDGGDARRLVWEIGGGWGGFAYQFKTLFPNTTYVIVDFPELFLFSATYLQTMFPSAVIRFVGDGTAVERWAEADFLFVPADRVERLRAQRPDLLVNLVSFQEMTAAQVHAYVTLAAECGCRRLYSLNRDRSVYNDEVDRVSAILAREYDLEDVTLLGSGYIKATKKNSAMTLDDAKRSGRFDPQGYRHLAGTLRPSAARRDDRAGARTDARVGIGLTVYNRAQYLREALDSLLAQTYGDFTLVIVDDGSSDGSEAIAREYVQRDGRVRYVRHAQRRGMVETWRDAFEAATEGPTPPAYFAWASDHDRWHPDWLATLVDALDRDAAVVLAYPLTQRIDPEGRPLAKPAREFDTYGISDRDERWTLVSRSDSLAAGDLVYGLMRTEAVRESGIFRPVLCPDRLLIAELSLHGQIRQVPSVLWYRRQFAEGSIERQRFTLFAPGTAVPSRRTPPWAMHARSLWRTYGGGNAALGITPRDATAMVSAYAANYAWRHHRKSSVHRVLWATLDWPVWVYKRAKHGVLVSVYHVLVALRRAGIRP